MRILVTGGLGFIGSNFVRYMIDKADKVYVVDAMKLGSNLDNLRELDYEFILGDICDYELMAKLVKKVDVIVNFAAETHVDRSISDPFNFIQSNVMGTCIILRAIRENNQDIKLIHISTDEVYGDIKEGSFKEDDRLWPSSPYAASKASSDMFVLAYVRTYKIDALITRCTNNYGAYQFPEKLIPKTIIRSLMDMKVPLYGSGKNVRDWIYVEDHCRAIELLIDKGKRGGTYNISSGEEKTNIEVVKKILEIMKKDEDLIEFVEDRPGHDIRYSLDSEKIRGLGWEPKYNFEEGIKRTVEWYLENEWWWRPLADERVLHMTPWKLRW